MENAKIENLKCDFLSDFQTLLNIVKYWKKYILKVNFQVMRRFETLFIGFVHFFKHPFFDPICKVKHLKHSSLIERVPFKDTGDTVFEKLIKMSHFKKSLKIDYFFFCIFNELLSTQNVNVAP